MHYTPADSLRSVPCDITQMFSGEDATASLADLALTPESMKSDREDSVMSMSQDGYGSLKPEYGSDSQKKKPTKKRKSWGQELPTPTTNLGPRKRAKTPAEKEQRRIERVLRNRAAAQTSRERKRLEVEELESEKTVTENRCTFLENENRELIATIAMMKEQMRSLVDGKQPTTDFRPRNSTPVHSPVPLRTRTHSMSRTNSMSTIKIEPDEVRFPYQLRQATVDPRATALSSPLSTPKLVPIASIPNLTQHPAEVLCDLPCQLGVSRPWDPSKLDEESLRQWMILSLIILNMHLLCLRALSVAYSTVALPLGQIFHSLKAGKPLNLAGATSRHFAPLIFWLISTPNNPLKPTTDNIPSSTNHSNTSAHPTIRIMLLQRLLACSPALARFLQNATGRASLPISECQMNRLGRVTGGGDDGVDDDRLRLLAMMSKIAGSVQGSTRSFGRPRDSLFKDARAMPVTHADPAGEIRQLCQRFQEEFLSREERQVDGIENGVPRRIIGEAKFVLCPL